MRGLIRKSVHNYARRNGEDFPTSFPTPGDSDMRTFV